MSEQQPFHKTALLALLKAHPERAATVLEKIIGALPDSLEYCDISSAELANEILHLLTQERRYTVQMLDLNDAIRHFLTEDHNADPICGCGWSPNTDGGREAARMAIREHIADKKEQALVDRTGPL